MHDSAHLEAARRLVPELRARALAAEQAGQLPRTTVVQLLASGLTRLLQPARYGGAATQIKAHMNVCAALAHGCVSTGWCTFVWGVHNFLVARYPDATQEAMWGDTPELLTSASIGPVGRATLERDGVTISGQWGFNSGYDHAGALLLGAMSEVGPWLCLVRRSECTVIDNWQVAGLRATGSKDVVADNLFVPRDRVVHFADCVEPNRAMLTLVIAGPVLGAAQAAVELYGRELGPTASEAGKQRFARASAEVHAARVTLMYACQEVDLSLAKGEVLSPSTQLRIARDTAYASALCSGAVNEIFAAVSGRALHETNPLQRIWRDVAAGCSHARLRWDAAADAFADDALATLAQGR